MHLEDKPIHFSTELLFKPFPMGKATLQKLYYDLSQTAGAYENAALDGKGGPPRFFSRRGEKTRSIALFLPDRIVLIEEWTDIPLDTFIEKTAIVAGAVLDLFEIEAFRVHTVTIRTTFELTCFEDSRVFLLDHVCQQQGRIHPFFRRPIATGGLRFILPETPDHPGTLHVSVESFRDDPAAVFVEVKGIFKDIHIASSHSLEELAAHTKMLRAFIRDAVGPYLAQYDTDRL